MNDTTRDDLKELTEIEVEMLISEAIYLLEKSKGGKEPQELVHLGRLH